MNDSEMLSTFWEGISGCFESKVNINLSAHMRGGNKGRIDRGQPNKSKNSVAQCNVLNEHNKFPQKPSEIFKGFFSQEIEGED